MFVELKEVWPSNLRYSEQVKLWENYITFVKVLNEYEKQQVTIATAYMVVSNRDNSRSEIHNYDVGFKTYAFNL